MIQEQELVEVTQACPTCAGEGWVLGIDTDYEDHCCGGSDWECGGRGCTGPIQEQVAVQIQECCPDCGGSGAIRTLSDKADAPNPLNPKDSPHG